MHTEDPSVTSIPLCKKTNALRTSTLAQEGPLQVSKALKLPVFIDENELRDLLNFLEAQAGEFFIFLVQGVVKRDAGELAKEEFIGHYKNYIEMVRQGEVPSEKQFRSSFTSIFTLTTDVLYSIPIEEDSQLIKANRPIVQLQPHFIQFSKEDEEFRSMVYGQDAILWGIQFSYPQLYQDARTQEIHQVKDIPLFPNTRLFKALQKWVRDATLPTPFFIQGKRMNVPFRLGRNCFSWINTHPQLKAQEIRVHDTY